jgi:3-oxoacyl-[acyl-carrier protein] reductase
VSAKDRVAMVTGGARGIGYAIAEKLGSDGFSIVISDILAEAAGDAASKLNAKGVKTIAITGDVSKPESVEVMFKALLEELGRIDVLVNNAGITRDNLLLRLDDKDWDKVMNVNLKGAFLCTKAASRIMIKNRWGRIINISSVVGVMGNAGQSNYSASKAGLIGLTKSAAKELAGRNITVNAVAPGYIQTEMTESLPDSAKEAFLSIIPLKRPGRPADVAGVVSFLASDLAEYVTGQVIHCDGGMVM